jgi:hypothetical protein
VAPDLIAGATAGSTNVGPGASIPVNVTVNQAAPQPAGNVPMQGVNAITPVGVWNNGGGGTLSEDASDPGDMTTGSMTDAQSTTASTAPVSSGS